MRKLQGAIFENTIYVATRLPIRGNIWNGSSKAERLTGRSENEQKLNDADERRQLDARWDLNESLRALHTLIELQHWRRNQRDRILQDRSLTAQEQSEDLRFVDDLYEQKRADLKVDTRIFEDS